MVCTILNVSGQNSIYGTVLDENLDPYSGANILLNGSKGTVSDGEGAFVFRDVSGLRFSIRVSSVGYQEVVISGETDTVSKGLEIILTPALQELEEVSVNGNIDERIKRSESLSIRRVDEEFLREGRASTLMQTISSIPGINAVDVGTGISKPMIRGLGYYRVVVAQNGIKQEGQQWSNHHGVLIDQQAVSHVEIVKGPASLQYGSDAIGGVINVLPEQIPLKDGVSGELAFTAKGNTRWLGGSGELSFRKGAFFSHIALSYNSYGDFMIPETDSFLLPAPVSSPEASHKVVLGDQVCNTAGDERAVSVSAGIVKPWGNSYFQFTFYGTNTGFFDWQGMQNDSIRSLHAQDRSDLQLPYQQAKNYSIQHFTNRFFGKDKLEIALGYQFNDSREFSYLDDRTGNREEDLAFYREMGGLDLGLFLHTYSGNIVYSLKRSSRHFFKLGLNSQYQVHRTDGYNHILPEYTRFSSGLFLTHKYTITDKWILNSGARIDYTYFRMEESLNPDPEYGDPVFNPFFAQSYPGTAFSLGFNYLPARNVILKMNLGKSFRVPSAYELGAYGLHRHEVRFEKGDTGNEPEQAWQFDLGFEQKWRELTLQISPFLTYFSNYLYLNPTPELRPEGQVYAYRQTTALLTGTELSLIYKWKDRIQLNAGAEYVYAVNLDLRSALPFTPPLSQLTELSYLFKDSRTFENSKAGIGLLSVAEQNYTVPNELSTPGYNSVNLHAQTELFVGKQRVNLMIKVRNLLNASYFNHISFYRRMRIPEPGRDIQLFIRIPIE